MFKNASVRSTFFGWYIVVFQSINQKTKVVPSILVICLAPLPKTLEPVLSALDYIIDGYVFAIGPSIKPNEAVYLPYPKGFSIF